MMGLQRITSALGENTAELARMVVAAIVIVPLALVLLSHDRQIERNARGMDGLRQAIENIRAENFTAGDFVDFVLSQDGITEAEADSFRRAFRIPPPAVWQADSLLRLADEAMLVEIARLQARLDSLMRAR